MNFECFIVWIQQTIYNTYAAIITTQMWEAIVKADLSRRLQAKRKKNLLIEWIWSRFIDVFHALCRNDSNDFSYCSSKLQCNVCLSLIQHWPGLPPIYFASYGFIKIWNATGYNRSHISFSSVVCYIPLSSNIHTDYVHFQRNEIMITERFRTMVNLLKLKWFVFSQIKANFKWNG